MRDDKWTRRALADYLLSMPVILAHSRKGMRRRVARKLIYDTIIAPHSVINSIFRDIVGLHTYTTERVIELPLVEGLILTEPKDIRLLEIGSGDSPFILRLAGQGYQVLGADVHRYPYKHARIEFTRADAMALPFRDLSFNLVFAISTIEHIGLGFYGDTEAGEGDKRTINEISRVLKPGGRCIISVPFGCQGIPNFERVYDARSMNALLAGFRFVKKYYWLYENGTWIRISENKATHGPPLRAGGTLPSGVIIVEVMKA